MKYTMLFLVPYVTGLITGNMSLKYWFIVIPMLFLSNMAFQSIYKKWRDQDKRKE